MTLPDIRIYPTLTRQQLDDLFLPTLAALSAGEITTEERVLRSRVAVTCKSILFYKEEIAILTAKMAEMFQEAGLTLATNVACVETEPEEPGRSFFKHLAEKGQGQS